MNLNFIWTFLKRYGTVADILDTCNLINTLSKSLDTIKV